jgi:hypothetical protein
MASTLGAGVDPSVLGGNQIFVTLRKGKRWPPTVVDVRCKYEETIGHLKELVASKSGVTADKQLVRRPRSIAGSPASPRAERTKTLAGHISPDGGGVWSALSCSGMARSSVAICTTTSRYASLPNPDSLAWRGTLDVTDGAVSRQRWVLRGLGAAESAQPTHGVLPHRLRHGALQTLGSYRLPPLERRSSVIDRSYVRTMRMAERGAGLLA